VRGGGDQCPAALVEYPALTEALLDEDEQWQVLGDGERSFEVVVGRGLGTGRRPPP
jgi:hypothetical protein